MKLAITVSQQLSDVPLVCPAYEEISVLHSTPIYPNTRAVADELAGSVVCLTYKPCQGMCEARI